MPRVPTTASWTPPRASAASRKQSRARLRTPGRSTRPRAIDGALVFALPLPPADADGVANDTQAITVAITEKRAVTLHSGAADGVVAVLSVIDEITDRYDEAVGILGRNLEVHVGTVVDARHDVTPSDVVTESLRLATSVSRLQRDVRRLRRAVFRLQSFVPRGATTDPRQ